MSRNAAVYIIMGMGEARRTTRICFSGQLSKWVCVHSEATGTLQDYT